MKLSTTPSHWIKYLAILSVPGIFFCLFLQHVLRVGNELTIVVILFAYAILLGPIFQHAPRQPPESE